jgi:hypothetical protein
VADRYQAAAHGRPHLARMQQPDGGHAPSYG